MAGLVFWQTLDLSISQRCNRFNQRPWASRFFGTVSRLGDGVFWYCLTAMVAVVGGWSQGPLAAAWMLAVGRGMHDCL